MSEKETIIYSCSGFANTGYLADQVFRKLSKEGVGRGTCLVSIGADYPNFLKAAKEAGKNIVIEGCPMSCGKKIFEERGLQYTHYITTDFDVEKKKTKITQDVIDRVSDEIKAKIEGSDN